MTNPDELGRTTKIDMDDGTAASAAEALEIAQRRRIGVSLGPGWESSHTATAAVLTVIRSAVRAFKGGVFVETKEDAPVIHGWGRGQSLHPLLADAGSCLVDRVPDDVPVTIVIGGGTAANAAAGGTRLYVTWDGWAAGIVLDPARRLPERGDMALAGILGAAIAVSEAFGSTKGNVLATRRETGISLWRPDLYWRHPDGVGPALQFLPSGAWILGLGHLGQAYAWAIGSLPYPEAARPLIGLVDPQTVVEANIDTGVLLTNENIGQRKARVTARELETLGCSTILVERRFDTCFGRTPDEPAIALAGFDAPEPRRLLETAGFTHVVDAGLGARHRYLDIVVRAFPAELQAGTSFPARDATPADDLLALPAYEAEIASFEAQGVSAEAARCGVTDLAGRTAGAAFVGAAAAALAVSEALKDLHQGRRLAVVSISLSDLGSMRIAANPRPYPSNPGFVRID